MNRKRVYIIDNDTVSLSLYSNLIVSDTIEVLPFESSKSFMETFDDSAPSCALIDVGVLCEGGSVYDEMLSRDIDIPTIFMASNYEVTSVVELFRKGAYDCVSKNYFDCATLTNKINSALIVSQKSFLHRNRVKEYKDIVACLTERESDILTLLSSGLTAKVIARQLKISYRTVETHVANMRMKTKMDTAHLVNTTIYQQMNTLRNK